jgi:hypothetical protein
MGDQASVPIYWALGSLTFPSLFTGRVTPKSQSLTPWKQCCGFGMFISDPNFLSIPDPGSDFFLTRIPDLQLHQRI